jgi:predicted DNA-binding transcriptional regulator AlpA
VSALTRQQLCAELSISESTIYRLEHEGLPYSLIGIRRKRYDLDECKAWLRNRTQCLSGPTKKEGGMSALWSMENAFIESSRKVRLRVMPSGSKLKSVRRLGDAA